MAQITPNPFTNVCANAASAQWRLDVFWWENSVQLAARQSETNGIYRLQTLKKHAINFGGEVQQARHRRGLFRGPKTGSFKYCDGDVAARCNLNLFSLVAAAQATQRRTVFSFSQ